ncbi:MAG TPA: hypothetical protein VGO71_09230 [Baekduia sp.]|nr:hypothetical protein [Baekduia sp.]
MIASLVGATGAQAAPAFHCEASALRATVAGTQTVEPVTRGRGADCTTGSATPSLALPPLLSAQALFADTTFDAASPSGSATGGIAHLAVLPSPELIAQAQAPIVAAIKALEPLKLSLPGLPPVPGLPPITGVQVDISAALLALIPPVPSSLVSVDLLNAQANVGCGGGAAVFSGASQVAGVKLLGQDIGLDGVLDQTLPLINAQSIALSQLDFTKVKVYDPTGLTQITAPLVLAAVKPALAALPPISLPASPITVQLIPNEQVRGDDYLIQRALHAAITLAGQPVLDAVLGEAKVSADAGMCAPATVPPAPTAAAAKAAGSAGAQGSVADQLLACSDRKLVLVDVLEQGSRVKLLGAANRSYVGKRVAIRLRATGRVVAHATVRKDGSFQTTAAMPPRAYLATHEKANSVRYRAEIGKELSLPLKLQRRLIVNSLTSKDGKVTIAGRVVRPLTTPVSTIRIVRRVSCHKVVLVKRFKPNADGTFRVTVKAPKGQAAAIYRLATSVREKASNPRSYPTFTLPRGVALNTR